MLVSDILPHNCHYSFYVIHIQHIEIVQNSFNVSDYFEIFLLIEKPNDNMNLFHSSSQTYIIIK